MQQHTSHRRHQAAAQTCTQKQSHPCPDVRGPQTQRMPPVQGHSSGGVGTVTENGPPTLHVYSMVVREQQRNPHRGQLAFGNSKSLGIGTRVAQLRCGGGGWRCLQCARVSGPALSLPVSGRPPLWRARGQSATMQDCVPFQGRKKPSCARSQVHYAAVRGLGGQQPAEERARA
jgi:hypothetical protein